MRNMQKYLSEAAKNISPYQWEKIDGEKVLRFDTNTPPNPPKDLSIFLDSLKNNCPINEYMDPSYAKLKQLTAKYESVKPEMLTVTNSGDEAIDILAKTFLNPGDYFIVTPPTYDMFAIQSEINNGKPLNIPLKGKTFEVDADRIIRESKNPRVKLIFLCNPNNPTGTIISPETIERIIKKSNTIVVIDEAYREFYGKSAVTFLKKYGNLIILRSFSKFAAIAGARIGYLIADKYVSQKFDGIRFPLGVSYFSSKLAEFVLERNSYWIKQQVKMIIKERKRLTGVLNSFGFKVYPSEANFLLVFVGDKAKDLCQKLKKKGIIIRDRSSKKYLEGCVRITVRNLEENNQLITGIKEGLYET